jgi:nifR3 family TIM-barrel protein
MNVWKPFSIGPISVAGPAVLGAMAGFTDLPYRRLCRQLGAPLCFTEMMLAKLLLHSEKLRRRLIHIDAGDHPVIGQLLGGEPEEMAGAAAILDAMGFDGIDLNFACPVRKALRRRRGGFVMKSPELAGQIVRAVRAATSRPVTLKLRSRFAAEEDHAAFWRIAEEAFDAGVAAICVHGRSVEAMYSGAADWEFLAEVKRRFPDRTILGSGDAADAAAILRMLEQTGVDGVAVARGALGNPWIFQQAADLAAGRQPATIGYAQHRELIGRHLEAAVAMYGPKRAPRRMHKFGVRYARFGPHPKALRAAYLAATTVEQWRDVLDTMYGPDGPA